MNCGCVLSGCTRALRGQLVEIFEQSWMERPCVMSTWNIHTLYVILSDLLHPGIDVVRD